jgi:hypothetical protein
MGKRFLGGSQMVGRMRATRPQGAAHGARLGRRAGSGLGALVFAAALLVAGVAFPAVSSAAPASSVSTPAVTVTTSPAAGARAGYTVAFTTSATGGLSGSTGSTVTIVFPAGTGLSTLSSANLKDTTTGQFVASAGPSSTTTLTFHLFSAAVVNAGDALSADVEGAVNPATASSTYTVTVSTSSDTTPVASSHYAIVAKHTVSIAMVSPSNHTPGATNVGYTVAFKASATGGMSRSANSSVTIVFPAGTGLSTLSNATLTDTTTGQFIGSANPSSTTTLTFFFACGSGCVVNAGDHLSATLAGASNPGSASSSDTAKVSTSSDITPVTSCPYFIGAGPAAPCVTSISPKSGPAAGGTSVTISGLNFTGATAVKFGTAAATGVVVHSATSITATAPPGTGTVKVTVTTPAGTSPTSPFDRFKYI